MQIGMIGLGRMGANMARRLLAGGHQCVVFDTSPTAVEELTINAAIDEAVPVPVLSAALYQRFSSRGEGEYQQRLLSAMRYGFGGHLEKPVDPKRSSR